MKTLIQSIWAIGLCSTFLAGCGGGEVDQVLPTTEGTPAAYTVAYLQAHPNLLVQPEHLIIARLDPAVAGGDRQVVRLGVEQEITFSLDSSGTASALAEVTILDDSGQVVAAHAQGDGTSTVTLEPGYYTIVFQAVPQQTVAQTLYLKLADTAAQAAARNAAASTGAAGGLLGASASPTSLGVVSGEICEDCSFDNSDLSNVDLSNSLLGGSSFKFVTLSGTNFKGVDCHQCVISFYGQSAGNTDFTDANLASATLSGSFGGVTFSGAQMDGATLVLDFRNANFSPSATGPTLITDADLTKALLGGANIQHAYFNASKFTSFTQFEDVLGDPPGTEAFVGTSFDNVTPVNLLDPLDFKNMDFTGTSFARLDLSHKDMSVSNGVKISPAGVAYAVLSDGTTGANLSGQDFGSEFAGWGGSDGIAGTGRSLRYVNLASANLYGADLSETDLTGANLVGANLSDANLYGASLVGALLGVAPGQGTAQPANLSNAYMPMADLTEADLRSVNMGYVHLYTLDGTSGVSFVRAKLDSAILTNALLMGASFSQASLNDADLSGAALVNAVFDGAILSNTKFGKAYLQGANFNGAATVLGANLNNAAISGNGSTDGANPWQFTEFDQVTHSYAYGPTQLGPIATTSAVSCPNGSAGPCTSPAALQALSQPPYPPVPQCTPLKQYKYANCDPGWTPPSD